VVGTKRVSNKSVWWVYRRRGISRYTSHPDPASPFVASHDSRGSIGEMMRIKCAYTAVLIHCAHTTVLIRCTQSLRLNHCASITAPRTLTAPHCTPTIRYCTLLHDAARCCTLLHCTLLHATARYCTLLHTTARYCTLLHDTAYRCAGRTWCLRRSRGGR
jgi:hypothetical protein